MAARKKAPAKKPVQYARPSRSGSKMTLGLAGNPLISVGMRMAPLVPSTAGRLAAHNYCVDHDERVKSRYVCATTGEQVETYSGYEIDGKIVSIEKESLGLDDTKRIELEALVDPAGIDPLYFEKAYALWPDEGQELALDQMAAALRVSGKAAIGTTVLSGSTRAIVVRWSAQARCLIAHVCTYDERIAWNDVEAIVSGQSQRGGVEDAQAAATAKLLEQTLGTEFAFDEVEDDYGVELEAAVEAAAKGVERPVKAAAPQMAPVLDLTAALQAAVEQVKPKPKPRAKPRAKAKVKEAA